MCQYLDNILVIIIFFPSTSPPLFPAFTLFQLVAVGLASFFAAALLSALAYSYCYNLNRPSAESAAIHPSTPNHLTYNKQGNTTPKNEKYIPMEFKVGCCNLLSTPLSFWEISLSAISLVLWVPPKSSVTKWASVRVMFTTRCHIVFIDRGYSCFSSALWNHCTRVAVLHQHIVPSEIALLQIFTYYLHVL